jgi:hypothetical protein
MDPYLEGSLWTSVRTQLGVEIQRQLVPLLRPRYIALTTERFVITTADLSETRADIYPDVSVSDGGQIPMGATQGVAIAAPLQVPTVMPDAIPHISVEIRDVAERRLVTDIEILSPTNKRSDGRSEYLLRRERLLMSAAHLIEIDLLRLGQRVPMRKALPAEPYFVFLSRAERRPLTEVWPIALDARLPVVPVPLLAGDADVPLDLQRALSNVYDLAGYDLAVDYTRRPEVPLAPGDAAWATERLRASGKLGE